MTLDIHNPEHIRAIDAELKAIESRLNALLKHGPFGVPDEIVDLSTPSPRGLADIPRAAFHVRAVRHQLAAGYVGLR